MVWAWFGDGLGMVWDGFGIVSFYRFVVFENGMIPRIVQEYCSCNCNGVLRLIVVSLSQMKSTQRKWVFAFLLHFL
jgi:hypothetical protein